MQLEPDLTVFTFSYLARAKAGGQICDKVNTTTVTIATKLLIAPSAMVDGSAEQKC